METKNLKLSTLLMLTAIFSLPVLAAFADGGAGMDPGRAAAFKSCKTQNNVTFPMDSISRQTMENCMKDAGYPFDPSKRHHHHHHFWKKIQACVQGKGVQLPAFTPGQKPTFTDQQKTAFQQCKAQLKAQHQAKQNSSGTAQ